MPEAGPALAGPSAENRAAAKGQSLKAGGWSGAEPIQPPSCPYAQGGTHRYCCGLASRRFASSSTGPNSMHFAWQWNTQEGSLPFSRRSAHRSQICVNAGMKS